MTDKIELSMIDINVFDQVFSFALQYDGTFYIKPIAKKNTVDWSFGPSFILFYGANQLCMAAFLLLVKLYVMWKYFGNVAYAVYNVYKDFSQDIQAYSLQKFTQIYFHQLQQKL